MLISVVIPTMNKVALLRRTLGALRVQAVADDTEWEIVVVDDGSTDGTAEFLAGVAADELPALTVVSPPQNVGRARARNLGARAARGRYLLFIDDDIVAPPGLVASHLRVLAQHPDDGTIGYAVTDPALVDAPHFAYMDTRGVARLAAGRAPARFFVTQNATVPRQLFLSVGGFDEDFSSYGFEDMEVAFRLEDAGMCFWVVTGPVPIHVHHHTAPEYFAKKTECGRMSLPHLARLHPERLREMRLHHIVKGTAGASNGLLARSVGWFATGIAGRYLPKLMARWPMLSGSRPLFSGVYFRLMNLTVLCLYRQGGSE